jgi:hypothetical protein
MLCGSAACVSVDPRSGRVHAAKRAIIFGGLEERRKQLDVPIRDNERPQLSAAAFLSRSY